MLQSQFGAAIQEVTQEGWVKLDRGHLLEIAQFVKKQNDLSMDMLHCITGVDLGGGTLECIYIFTSTTHKHWLTVKVDVKVEDPKLPTLSHIWPTANWHEREAFDLLGFMFTDHPNLKRILCHEDWVGYPLRKDYEFPKEFEGIKRDLVLEEDDVMPRTVKKG